MARGGYPGRLIGPQTRRRDQDRARRRKRRHHNRQWPIALGGIRLRLVLRRLRNKVSEAAKALLRNPQRLVSARDIGVTSVPVPIIGLADDQARDKRDLYHVCGDAPAIWRVRLMSLAAEI